MAVANILEAPTRIKNKRRTHLFTGIRFPLIGFLLTIFFIKRGYTYEALIFFNFRNEYSFSYNIFFK